MQKSTNLSTIVKHNSEDFINDILLTLSLMKSTIKNHFVIHENDIAAVS